MTGSTTNDDNNDSPAVHSNEDDRQQDDVAVTEPETKKAKMTVPEAPDAEWPEAWLMTEGDAYADQKAPNRREPNVPVTPDQMRHLGIHYWKMDAEGHEYPTMAVPWDPKVRRDNRQSCFQQQPSSDIIVLDFRSNRARSVVNLFPPSHSHHYDRTRSMKSSKPYAMIVAIRMLTLLQFILTICPNTRPN